MKNNKKTVLFLPACVTLQRYETKKNRNIYDRSFCYIRHIYITIGSEIAGCLTFHKNNKNSSISACLCRHIKGAQNQKNQDRKIKAKNLTLTLTVYMIHNYLIVFLVNYRPTYEDYVVVRPFELCTQMESSDQNIRAR